MEIILATGNPDKVKEIKEIFKDTQIEVKSAKDLGIEDFEVDEDGETLKENALKKAKTLFNKIKKPTFADDTGLFVNSLNLMPGVKSHRYAGENVTYADNRKKLLDEMKEKDDRSAYFETVICFIDADGNERYFQGKVLGEILREEKGNNGFGYDSLFKPSESEKTFAEMTSAEKDKISHRARAIIKLKEYLLS
ncbi:MAG: RdgB/HAM1 family non-canonical purine NTP pyrophosphatase [Peptoniphilaceae bacterium]|nr:RdgB/HAM1 family non-canonical purine NTP pyrophosphatase [Peptoniphilaceae bacterium]MDD7383438.1 RdgB/HAM1 family non-canonical purine NTP pyrophosphatase [Peptoniphilaceae bacterium]MDY3738498.1 RdgB/HAM1 family non-canonical purine NTP pyrophosphatase [Peptoniphilaceae bacterium]